MAGRGKAEVRRREAHFSPFGSGADPLGPMSRVDRLSRKDGFRFEALDSQGSRSNCVVQCGLARLGSCKDHGPAVAVSADPPRITKRDVAQGVHLVEA